MIHTLRSGFAAALVGLTMLATPAAALDGEAGTVEAASPRAALRAALPAVPMSGAVTLVPIELTTPVLPPTGPRRAAAVPRPSPGDSRGTLLPSLYVSLGALNAIDAYTTTVGMSRGAVEANPLMRPFANNPAAMWAVKGGVTAASIYMAERLWKKQRKVEAIAVMAISNGMMAVVAARNAAVLSGR